jgi:DnaJ-class molecular chaperone
MVVMLLRESTSSLIYLIALLGVFDMSMMCWTCGGQGRVSRVCHSCGGRGHREESEPCGSCCGSGYNRSAPGGLQPCGSCGGGGYITKRVYCYSCSGGTSEVSCDSCGGSGKKG